MVLIICGLGYLAVLIIVAWHVMRLSEAELWEAKDWVTRRFFIPTILSGGLLYMFFVKTSGRKSAVWRNGLLFGSFMLYPVTWPLGTSLLTVNPAVRRRLLDWLAAAQ